MLKTLLFFSLFVPSCAFLQKNNGFRNVHSSPRKEMVPPSEKLRYIIDIDGTICTKTPSDYKNSKPIYKNIDIFNDLYHEGHEIHYWTARGALSGKTWDILTICQLQKWNVKYDSLNMGKPHYDVWIDDKAINAFDFVENKYQEKKNDYL